MTAPTTDNDSEQVQNIDLSKTRKEKKDHDSIVAWAKKQYEQMRSDRSITERQWYINLAFYFGRQNVAPVRSGNYSGGKGNTTTRLYVPPAPYYRARPVINRIRPTIRTELSMLTGNKPTATVVPASAEDRDTYAANAAEQIWIAEYTNKDLKAKIRRAMWWTCVTGCGYMKTWWDASAGETDRKTGLPQGDIKYTHETPFHVLAPDLREEELENQPFIMHAQMKSKEWVKANYRTAIDGTGVDVKSVAGNNEILDSSFLDLMGATYQNQRNEVLVLEAWVKPGAHERFPDGAMFTIIGDKIVQGYEGWPYSHEMFPFAKFDHIPTGKFYYASSIEDLVPLQKEYNRCFDEKTQILTESGWKYGKDVEVGENVLTFDTDARRMRFSPVREMFKKHYTGSMEILDGRQISAKTTPGHKWFVRTSSGYYKTVEELNSDHSIPLCAPVDKEGDNNYSFNKIVGLVLSDGRINNHRVLISQSKRANSDKCSYIEDLLEDEGICYSEYTVKDEVVEYYIPVEYSVAIRRAIPYKKLSSEYIMTLGNKGLQGLFDGLMLGDGMYEGDKGAKFYTAYKSEADLFQMVASLLGYASTVRSQDARSDWAMEIEQFVVQVKTDKFSNASVIRSKQEDEWYDGEIWCPTVDTGFVYVRRDGKPYISGNTRGQIIEAKNRMAKPQMAAQRGAVDASKITSEPGLLIEYTPGFEAPTPVPLQDLPSYVIQEQDRLVNDWQDIAGIHEVSQGEVPPGVTAATAISYLQERDESKLTPTFDSLEEGLQKIARMGLTYVKDYWTTERTVKTTGEQSYFDVLTFKGSDLRGNTDIRIESGSSLPVSKSAKQALIMDLMKMGFIPPEKGLQVMDMGGISKLYEQVQIDRKQVQRENMKMSKVTMKMMDEYQQQNEELLAANPYHFGVSQDPQTGQQIPKRPPAIVPVNTWDNHKLHIQYHNDYRKTQDFENLPQFVKDLFEEHVMQHVMALGAEQQTMNPAFAAGTEQSGAGQSGAGQPGMENPEEEPEQGSAKEPGQPPVGNAKQSGEQGPDPIPKTQDEVQE